MHSFQITFPPTARTHTDAMHAALRALPFVLVLFMLLAPAESSCQSRLRLKRTNATSTPFSIILYGGYNGMSSPSNKLQDLFENTVSTSWGGILMGAMGLVTIDTLWKPLSAGAEFYYQRVVARALANRPEVRYIDEAGPVNAIETLYAYGAQAVVAYDIHLSVQIILGGGVQFVVSRSDVSRVTGLFTEQTIPTAMAAVNYRLLRYEHGSINGMVRFMQGFGEWGSFELQSALAFSFDF